MNPPEAVVRELVAQWLNKAETDFEAAEHLVTEDRRFRDVIGFHCQQAVEKYLKAFLVQHQVEFPKTHDISKLLALIAGIDSGVAESLGDAEVLTPFGVEVRYASDAAEVLPGGETEAIEIARRVRQAIVPILDHASRPSNGEA
jgi:HEPN domain-containing protein